jgi:hypothetical protein
VTLSFVVSGRDFNVPAGFEGQYGELLRQSERGEVLVTIEPVTKERTLRENAYFHTLCGRLAAMSGASKEQVKEMAKSRAVELGYPAVTDADGVMERGEYGARGIPSHEATNRQFLLLIEAVRMIASENGYELEG